MKPLVIVFNSLAMQFTFKEKKVIAITFLTETSAQDKLHPFYITAATSLQRYFNGLTPSLQVPHRLIATPYQTKVLTASKMIPCGSQWSYSELAKRIHSHPRAVGQALARNPLPLIYPCHRVVGKQGLTGFLASTTEENMALKETLLRLEKVASSSLPAYT